MIWLFWFGILIGGIIGACMAYWAETDSLVDRERIERTTENGVREIQEISCTIPGRDTGRMPRDD